MAEPELFLETSEMEAISIINVITWLATPNVVHEPPPEHAAPRGPTITAGGRSARCTCRAAAISAHVPAEEQVTHGLQRQRISESTQ